MEKTGQTISNGLLVNRFMRGGSIPTEKELGLLTLDELCYLTSVWCQRFGLRTLRLKRFKEIDAPAIMIKTEKRLIKEAEEMSWAFDSEYEMRKKKMTKEEIDARIREIEASLKRRGE